jgi:translocation and assembly module TamA
MSMGKGKARWLAAAMGLGLSPPALAQAVPAPPRPGTAELDLDAPLDPMPDLGVAWPDMGETPAPLEANAPTAAAQAAGDSAVADFGTTRDYRVLLDGLAGTEAESALREAFDRDSLLVAGRGKPVNAAQIDRRARDDSELLAELLRAEGYYDAEVEPKIALDSGAVAVTLLARPGNRYRFAGVDLPGLEQADPAELAALRAAFAVKQGEPVVAQAVIDAGNALKIALGERGFATAAIGEQDIVIDHETATARLVLPVTPGPVATFGAIRVAGSPPFPARHVGKIARFDPGDRFEQSEVDDLRRALVATGLVAVAEVRKVPRDGGRVIDLEVALQPAPPRTLAGELGYGTGEGVRAEASWQHRNFFNPEGALTLRGVAGTQEQLAAATLRRNNFRARDQVGYVQLLVSHVDRKAYDAKTASLAAGIERQSNFIWQKKWTWSVGGELLASRERDADDLTGVTRVRTFKIAALPLGLAYDGSDNLLDPTRGFRLGVRASPEVSIQDAAKLGYTKLQLDGSAYRAIGARTVAAGRVRLATILGGTRDDIAPSRRLYSGGGGSVRGYGYQRLGPRDAAGDPIGGKSLTEFALEARVRLGSFGIVPFVDGGNLTTGSLPGARGWQFGAGIGARYYSSFGPIRIDVGTPLNPQAGDSRVAVTVSLGQAF